MSGARAGENEELLHGHSAAVMSQLYGVHNIFAIYSMQFLLL